jgi:hypothetical protein
MPTRLLRDGILDSAAVNTLSFPAEVFYRRLMSVVDDFGRFDGRAAVLRGRLYPLKIDTVREADIARWIAECEKAGLIALYAVDHKPYLLFHRLGTPRAKESKYPPPPADVTAGRKHLFTDANGCAQAHADVPYSYSDSDSGASSNATPTGGAAAEPPPAEPAPVKPARERKPPSGPHAEAVRFFVDSWAELYGGKYPFDGGKDAAAVKAILGHVGDDLDKFRAVVSRYFVNSEPFFSGHRLSLLRSQLPKFLVDAPATPRRGGFQTHDDRVMGDIYDALRDAT